jgi:hypothetical protein
MLPTQCRLTAIAFERYVEASFSPVDQCARRASTLIHIEPKGGARMNSQSLYGVVRAVALVVLLAMLASVVYAGYMSVTHWSGIGV